MLSKGRKVDFVDRETVWERCVLCGRQTEVLRESPIGERKYYVEAAGQLCEECYGRVYVRVHNDDLIK